VEISFGKPIAPDTDPSKVVDSLQRFFVSSDAAKNGYKNGGRFNRARSGSKAGRS
jgi:hypothetical protein